MLDQPPLFEVENIKPDEDTSFSDSFGGEKGYFTPKTGDELKEIKQLLLGSSNNKYENSFNAMIDESSSSKTSKNISSSGKFPSFGEKNEFTQGKHEKLG
jgi:hypothetical protein